MQFTITDKLTEILDRRINPIWLLELRTNLRTDRFFGAFVLALLLSVIVMIIGLLSMASDYRQNPDEIGRGLFILFIFMEHAIVAIFFPAFACTSIIGEQERKSLDLVINSDLKPSEIAWGKFLSAFTYAFLFLTASLPLIIMAFLFGGVNPSAMVLGYLLLFFIATLYIMVSLLASSLFKTVVRAIIATYVVIFLISLFLMIAGAILVEQYFYRGDFMRIFSEEWNLNHISAIGIPICALVGMAVFSYLLTVCQLKSTHENRSTSLRIYCAVTITFFIGIFTVILFYNVHQYIKAGSMVHDGIYMFSVIGNASVTVLMLIAAMVFGLGSTVAPVHIVSRMKKHKYFRSILWLFYPGVLSGAVYTSFFSALFFAMIYLAVWKSTDGFNASIFSKDSNFNTPICFWMGPLVLWSFIFFASMLCAFITLRWQESRLRKIVAVGIIVFLVVILPLYMPLSMAIEDRYRAAPWDLCYLAPVLCYWSGLANVNNLGSKINLSIGYIPIHYLEILIYYTAGSLLLLKNIKMHNLAFKEIQRREKSLSSLKPENL